jgi:hypothetical protein
MRLLRRSSTRRAPRLWGRVSLRSSSATALCWQQTISVCGPSAELTSASFGSLARFKDVQRIFAVGDKTLIAYSGDVSDAQHIQHLLEALMYPLLLLCSPRIREGHHQDQHLPNPLTIHNYLTRELYNRRTKMDPLWNALLVAGVTPPSDTPMATLPNSLQPGDAVAPAKVASETSTDKLDGHVFLGYVDLYATSYSSNHIATYAPLDCR